MEADKVQKTNSTSSASAAAFVANTIPIQCRLTVGAVNDPLEHEADAMADKVMRMPAGSLVQRKCHCDEEEKAQRKPLASFIQKKENGGDAGVSDTVANQVNTTRGGGSRMDASTASFMESSFGTGFHNVRVHTGDYATQLSHQLNAQAFTIGNDIYFNEGRYAPGTSEGKHLLAHELTHVIQQGANTENDDTARRQLVEGHSTTGCIQRKWWLDSINVQQKNEASYRHGNASIAISGENSKSTMSGAVGVNAKAWQEASFYIEGGQAQVAHGITKHFIFKSDGVDDNFLQLSMYPSISGNAKAEDTNYARAAGIVWGEITERTAANATPPPKLLFDMEEGGISTAKVGDLGTIEADIPIGPVSSKVEINLTRVKEGDLSPFSHSEPKPYDVPLGITEVDVFLGAQSKADADITTDFWGVDGDVNSARALSSFNLAWVNRAVPPAKQVQVPVETVDIAAKGKLSYPADCKRNTLISAASKGGCSTREGGSHTIVYKNDQQVTTIPRSIKENGTCRGIIKALNENCL